MEPIDFGLKDQLKDQSGIQHVFEDVQHCMKLELTIFCAVFILLAI